MASHPHLITKDPTFPPGERLKNESCYENSAIKMWNHKLRKVLVEKVTLKMDRMLEVSLLVKVWSF